jgi:D-3-phosphoglycerate dehydrogenase
VLPRGNCDHRITIKNHNVPNIIGEVSTTLAKNSINICDMLNKSKGDIAFNIMELSGALSEAVVGELEAIEGVISVRLI